MNCVVALLANENDALKVDNIHTRKGIDFVGFDFRSVITLGSTENTTNIVFYEMSVTYARPFALESQAQVAVPD